MIFIGHKLKHPGRYVGRPTALGNPASHKSAGIIQVPSLSVALDYYDNWLRTRLQDTYSEQSLLIDLIEEEARHKDINLLCYCSRYLRPWNHQPFCHADVVAAIVMKRLSND